MYGIVSWLNNLGLPLSGLLKFVIVVRCSHLDVDQSLFILLFLCLLQQCHLHSQVHSGTTTGGWKLRWNGLIQFHL